MGGGGRGRRKERRREKRVRERWPGKQKRDEKLKGGDSVSVEDDIFTLPRKPICVPTRLSEVSPVLPVKHFQR